MPVEVRHKQRAVVFPDKPAVGRCALAQGLLCESRLGDGFVLAAGLVALVSPEFAVLPGPAAWVGLEA